MRASVNPGRRVGLASPPRPWPPPARPHQLSSPSSSKREREQGWTANARISFHINTFAVLLIIDWEYRPIAEKRFYRQDLLHVGTLLELLTLGPTDSFIAESSHSMATADADAVGVARR